MANNNDHQALHQLLEEHLKGVYQELALQRIEIEKLIKRVKVLEENPPRSVPLLILALTPLQATGSL